MCACMCLLSVDVCVGICRHTYMQSKIACIEMAKIKG